MSARDYGRCPSCRRTIAVKKGVGPYNDGRGDVMDHKVNGRWCFGGKAEGGQVNALR